LLQILIIPNPLTIVEQQLDKYDYDNRGNLTRIKYLGDSAVGSQQLEYDLQFNQLIKFTDSNNNVTSYELDDSGNIKKQIRGKDTTEELVLTYTYNQQGQVATITDELNRVTKYSYYDGGSEQGLLQKLNSQMKQLINLPMMGQGIWLVLPMKGGRLLPTLTMD